jgi:hypothetical protein
VPKLAPAVPDGGSPCRCGFHRRRCA